MVDEQIYYKLQRFVVQLESTLKGVFEVTGGGTQNRTGVHGFADMLVILNSIFYNVQPGLQFDVLFTESNLESSGGRLALSGIDRSNDLMSGKATIQKAMLKFTKAS